MDLWAEEIVTGRENDWIGKGNGDLDLFACCWPLAVRSVQWLLIDAVHDRSQDREVGIQPAYGEAEGTQARITRSGVNFDVRR